MDHDAAKAVLFQADTQAQRTEAVAQALELGMPLTQIQDYLDWVDATRAEAVQPKTSWLSWFSDLIGLGKAWGFSNPSLTPEQSQVAHTSKPLPAKPR
jgi:hypothetical protein